MTFAAEPRAGVDLGHRHVEAPHPVGVHRALDVALEHADADTGQIDDDALQQRRLAGSGGAHEVDHRDTGAVEVGAFGGGDRVVGVKRLLHDSHLGAMHAASSTSIDSTSNSSPLAIM